MEVAADFRALGGMTASSVPAARPFEQPSPALAEANCTPVGRLTVSVTASATQQLPQMQEDKQNQQTFNLQ